MRACCVFGFTAVTRAQSSSSIWICLKASLDSIWARCAFATVHAILIVCIARSPAYGRHTSVNYSRYGNLLRLVTHSRNLIVTTVEWICDTRAIPILTRTRRVRQVNAKFHQVPLFGNAYALAPEYQMDNTRFDSFAKSDQLLLCSYDTNRT